MKVNGLGLGAAARTEVFAGAANYRAVLADTQFWQSALRVLIYGCLLVPTMLRLALVFALLLDLPRARARRFSRTAIFLPYAVPAVIASLMWGFMYLLAAAGYHPVDLLTPTTIYLSVANIWRIKIPMLTPALIMTVVFSLIATLQVFTEPTTLRPLTNALPSNWTPLMKIYQDAFARDDIYSASAASVVLALATLLFSFGFLRLVQRRAFGQEG